MFQTKPSSPGNSFGKFYIPKVLLPLEFGLCYSVESRSPCPSPSGSLLFWQWPLRHQTYWILNKNLWRLSVDLYHSHFHQLSRLIHTWLAPSREDGGDFIDVISPTSQYIFHFKPKTSAELGRCLLLHCLYSGWSSIALRVLDGNILQLHNPIVLWCVQHFCLLNIILKFSFEETKYPILLSTIWKTRLHL